MRFWPRRKTAHPPTTEYLNGFRDCLNTRLDAYEDEVFDELKLWFEERYGLLDDDEVDRDEEIVALDALDDDWEDDEPFDVAMLDDELDDLDFLPEVVA